MLREPNWKVIF